MTVRVLTPVAEPPKRTLQARLLPRQLAQGFLNQPVASGLELLALAEGAGRGTDGPGATARHFACAFAPLQPKGSVNAARAAQPSKLRRETDRARPLALLGETTESVISFCRPGKRFLRDVEAS